MIAPDGHDDRWMRRMHLSAVKQVAAEVDQFHGSLHLLVRSATNLPDLQAGADSGAMAPANKEVASMETLSEILDDTSSFEKVASGFVFTEGPLWHPDGFFYFVDVRGSGLFKIALGHPFEKIRETQGG